VFGPAVFFSFLIFYFENSRQKKFKAVNNRGVFFISGDLIKLKKISRIYKMGSREVEALKDIDLNIPSGKMVIVKGPSGSGKTTILNIMGGLDQPTSGEVILGGQKLNSLSEKEITDLRRNKIGFIFQSFGLIQSFTAFENVELPLRIQHKSYKLRNRRVEECLEIVGLAERKDHRIFELSGGEQQRVGIARALAVNPSIILADEPTGEVDYLTGQKIMELFQEMIDQQGLTICVATHDPAAMEYGDIVYEIRDGKIRKKG